jgi:macrolide phosphotransferase
VTRTPAYLAALASSAVPGLDPVAVRAARELPGNRCDVAFVTDTQRRAWVVRVPTTPAVGAQLDTAVPLLGLIARRLPFQVPSPRGFVAVPDGRAVVYPFLHGRSVVLEEVPPGPGVAAELGRALAALQNVSAWRFAPTPVHGDVRGARLLVSFAQDDDPGTATVRGLTGWEHAKVADPADDLAAFAAECAPETFESVVEAYAVARIERPDRHLRLRARLAAELRALAGLLDAVSAGEPLLITRRAAELRSLDEQTADLPDLVPPSPVEPERPARVVVASGGAAGGTAGDPAGDTAGGAGSLGTDEGEREGQPEGAPDDEDQDVEQERDDSQDTQRLLVGDAAGATTVIPPEELARLRETTSGDETMEGLDPGPVTDGADSQPEPLTEVVVVAVETEVARDDSWYHTIEPVTPPEATDDTGHTAETAETAGTDVIADTADTEPTADTEAAADTEASAVTGATENPIVSEAATPAGKPVRRHRRAQRP